MAVTWRRLVLESDSNWVDLTDGGATTLHKHDHGGQDGLADDDHAQYALLAGRSGGQTLVGGTGSGDNLTLQSTSNATKGNIICSGSNLVALSNDTDLRILGGTSGGYQQIYLASEPYGANPSIYGSIASSTNLQRNGRLVFFDDIGYCAFAFEVNRSSETQLNDPSQAAGTWLRALWIRSNAYVQIGYAMDFSEMTAPSAPAANGVRIYAEDNGSGKTRLMALFATGAAQQIAIQP